MWRGQSSSHVVMIQRQAPHKASADGEETGGGSYGSTENECTIWTAPRIWCFPRSPRRSFTFQTAHFDEFRPGSSHGEADLDPRVQADFGRELEA
ncbi:hypothetical protein HBI74_216830 [Parastagonospora nodorum]|nr:hypothetical protein HBI74_216830 [Parastagonospora nodorum]